MLEIMLNNKQGSIWDISEIVSSVTWKTSRIGKASSLDLTLIKGGLYQDTSFRVNNGDIIQVKKGNQGIFCGYVFDISFGRDEEVKIKAYDQLRYLMSNAYYVFKNATATQILKKIASDTNLPLGTVEETSYVIPVLKEENQKYLDIICKALTLTLISNGKNFIVYDDFGKLALRNIESMVVDFAIGDESLMLDFDYSHNIDNETYNIIKLIRVSKEKNKAEVFPDVDKTNVAKWGRLQLVEKVDDGLNEAQIKDRLAQLKQLKNREQKKLRIEAIGDSRVRAGCYVPVIIKELGVSQLFLVEDCTHKFEGEDHTMTLELKVI